VSDVLDVNRYYEDHEAAFTWISPSGTNFTDGVRFYNTSQGFVNAANAGVPVVWLDDAQALFHRCTTVPPCMGLNYAIYTANGSSVATLQIPGQPLVAVPLSSTRIYDQRGNAIWDLSNGPRVVWSGPPPRGMGSIVGLRVMYGYRGRVMVEAY